VPPPHGLPSGTMGRHDNKFIYIYREQCKQKLCDSSRQRLAPNVYISLFLGLSLSGADCQNCHMQPCLHCGFIGTHGGGCSEGVCAGRSEGNTEVGGNYEV